jgi:hypothetical protein
MTGKVVEPTEILNQLHPLLSALTTHPATGLTHPTLRFQLRRPMKPSAPTAGTLGQSLEDVTLTILKTRSAMANPP